MAACGFLQAGAGQVNVRNNILADNISAHEGGGIALDDSTNVHITGNTVAKNITTATAITSNGQPAPAGLSTATNSAQLQTRLAVERPEVQPAAGLPGQHLLPEPRGHAGTRRAARSRASTRPSPAADPKRVWDMGSLDVLTPLLTPTYSILTQSDPQVTASPTNKVSGATNYPQFITPYDVSVQIITSRRVPVLPGGRDRGQRGGAEHPGRLPPGRGRLAGRRPLASEPTPRCLATTSTTGLESCRWTSAPTPCRTR